jgi:hypothetical protein
MKFWPNTHAFGGFLATTRDSRHLRVMMEKSGAERHEAGRHTVYLWNMQMGRRLFSGVGIVDGKFVRGPVELTRQPEAMVGYCASLDIGEVIRVRTDAFGMYPVFYSDEFVTDRLHLAMMARPEVDVAAVLSMFHDDWMFGQQFNCKRTPVLGVRMLAVGERIEIDSRVRMHRSIDRSADQPIDPADYHDLIRKGADEIRANLTAILDNNKRVTCAITGGRDSRINLAALVSLGRAQDVRYTTLDVDDDLAIGSGLVKWAGGAYGSELPVDGWVPLTFEEAHEHRRSVNFGSHHFTSEKGLVVLHQLNENPQVLIGGGMGETFRTMYIEQGFGNHSPYSYAGIQEELIRHCTGDKFFPGLSTEISHLLGETFEDLTGKTIAERFEDHYLNYRNRLHFRGLHQASFGGAIDIHPLMAPSLLRAARSLPFSEKASGRVIYDVTRELCPTIARFPYGTPWPSDMTTSPYFNRALGPTDPISIVPAPELAAEGAKCTPAPRKPRPRMNIDVKALLETSFKENLEVLSSGIFPELSGQAFREYAQWAHSKKPQRWRVLASKIQAVVDYEAVSKEARGVALAD